MPEAHAGKADMPPQKSLLTARENVEAFLGRKNIVKANYNRIVCGDGRYTAEQSNGGLRMFGGDMGALAAYWKVGKEKGHFTSIEAAVEKYQAAKAKALSAFGVPEAEARRLYFHTDSHGNEVSGVYGCGHMANLTNGDHAGEEFYDTDAADMRALFHYVTTPGKVDHELMPLGGSHVEQTVIFVHSLGYTVHSSDSEGMHFVVDEDRVHDYFKRLASAAPMSEVTGDELFKVYKKQELTTARILAPGKQIVDVYITDLDQYNIVVDENKKVPAL